MEGEIEVHVFEGAAEEQELLRDGLVIHLERELHVPNFILKRVEEIFLVVDLKSGVDLTIDHWHYLLREVIVEVLQGLFIVVKIRALYIELFEEYLDKSDTLSFLFVEIRELAYLIIKISRPVNRINKRFPGVVISLFADELEIESELANGLHQFSKLSVELGE